MLITKITKAVMDNLKPDDVCITVIGGKVTVVERNDSGSSNYPHQIQFKEVSGEYSFTNSGIFEVGEVSPLDIISVEKALKIPEGFTRWDGGECPVMPDTPIEILFRQMGFTKEFTKYPQGFRWSCLDRESDIIAYRVIEPEVNEVWCVVSPTIGLYNFGTKEEAISWAKLNKHLTISAIFPTPIK